MVVTGITDEQDRSHTWILRWFFYESLHLDSAFSAHHLTASPPMQHPVHQGFGQTTYMSVLLYRFKFSPYHSTASVSPSSKVTLFFQPRSFSALVASA